AALEDEIAGMWRRLARFSGEPEAEVYARAAQVCDRVSRIRNATAQRHGYDQPVREERQAHAIVRHLDDQQQIAARADFGRYPWIKIEPSNRRVYHQAECLAHVLGRTGAVDAQQIENDPYADDDLRRYLANDTVGLSGAEFAAEDLLRGRRGRFRQSRSGEVLEDVPAQNGREAHLTLRYDLQQRLYSLLGSELPRLPYSPGGSIVVLDVGSRDVLALVSYPAYDPNRFGDMYDALRRDTVGMPLRFRAVSNRYAPGSIVKPLTCLAGLTSGAIGLSAKTECSGYLFPDNPEAGASKCWQIAGTGQRKAHGAINVVEALEGSCNVFMYNVGTAVGAEYLCNFFDMVGFGRPSGIGLREEAWGTNPTPEWINEVKGRGVVPADGRLFAIGQGLAEVTPIQAANLMATYAAEVYKPVRLIQDGPGDDELHLPVSVEHWRAIHEGLYAVVNSPAGTAYKHARFADDRYALCGKTGTATTHRRPISFKITYRAKDGSLAFTILPAGDRKQAIADFERLHPEATYDPRQVTFEARWPRVPSPEGKGHANSWFAGYFRRLDSAGRPMFDVTPRIAFAVLVEFGGSGGRTSGPIAQQVARILRETLGDELDPGAPAQEPRS
ncbi:MAG: penicillin-binding transpeptidase domain-containing protein, partial [Planctomycetota bacterium]